MSAFVETKCAVMDALGEIVHRNTLERAERLIAELDRLGYEIRRKS